MNTARTLFSARRAVAAIAGTAAILLGHAGNALAAAPPRPKTKPVQPTLSSVKPAKPATPPPAAPSGPQDETERRRAAVIKSLAMLQNGAASFTKLSGRSCQSCHHQMLPVMTLAIARERGLPVNETQAKAEHAGLEKMVSDAEKMLGPTRTDPAAQKSMDTADTPLMLGYILAGFAREKRAPDANTNAMAGYLLRAQRPTVRFPPTARASRWRAAPSLPLPWSCAPCKPTRRKPKQMRRKPSSHGRKPGSPPAPKTNEDRTFRLLGLRWSGADDATLQRAAADLLDAQNDDGGWSQLPGQLLSSDAYATGQALVALAEGGNVSHRRTGLAEGHQLPDGRPAPGRGVAGQETLHRAGALLRRRLPRRTGPVHLVCRHLLGDHGNRPRPAAQIGAEHNARPGRRDRPGTGHQVTNAFRFRRPFRFLRRTLCNPNKL
jgi:hypothetical protein